MQNETSPTVVEMVEEVVDLTSGAVTVLMPALLLAVPCLVLLLPLLVPLIVGGLFLGLVGAVLAGPILLIRKLRASSIERRRGMPAENTRAQATWG